ncbi:MAG: hypothetical protein WCS42_19460 [Verrucomicrobiota bacterium]
MNQTLKEHQLSLLQEIVKSRCPELAARVDLPDLSELKFHERQVILDALGIELLASGFKNYEPTQRGLQLEELIDVVNRPNIQK